MPVDNAGYQQIKVGDVVVTALNDGQFEAAPEWVAGLDAAGLEKQLQATFRPFPPRITLNAFLLEAGGRKILVDAGAGNKFGAALGAVAKRLKAVGVAPDDIDTILLTHAHVDHVGGLTDDAGAPVFAKAELVVNAIEHAFWLSEENRSRAPEGAQDAFKAAQAGLKAYASRTRLIEDGAAPVPGVRARLFPGHTPGHTGYQVDSGPDTLLIWGDIVHLPGVQFALPDVGMGFDSDLAQARATRRKVFDEVVGARTLFAGMHLDFPTFAHLRSHAGRYEVEPMVWAPVP
jgi:glyoxylase-like metal-dependent hydrolase (beta-lactamase superfamily II)